MLKRCHCEEENPRYDPVFFDLNAEEHASGMICLMSYKVICRCCGGFIRWMPANTFVNWENFYKEQQGTYDTK